ncbi:MAG: hypothetical protein AB7I35_14145 [Ramlibacter sp.]
MGEILAIVAVAIIGLMLWVARQARIVGEEVRATRVAAEAADQAEEHVMRRKSARLRRRARRRMC